MLAADLIGTHTYSSARHLISSCCRHLGITQRVQRNSNICLQWGSRSVCVYISHVGLDSAVASVSTTHRQYLAPLLRSSEVLDATAQIRARYGDRRIIAAVDELDPINGILLKLQGFHKLLQDNPDARQRLVLVQVCFRPRSIQAGGARQKSYESQLREAAAACNAEFPDSVALRLLTGSFYPVQKRLALWKAAALYLNTAFSQGLNPHPQEYLLARAQEGGVLVVSEFASAHEFLNGALSVNPWDIESIAQKLEYAVEMGRDEVQLRQNRDLESIQKREQKVWLSLVLQNLADSASEESMQTSRDPGDGVLSEDDADSLLLHLNVRLSFRAAEPQIGEVAAAYRESHRRFFMLDYGGTLQSKEGFNRDLKDDFRGVLHRPPNRAMSEVLQRLCYDRENEVWVISSIGSMVMEKTLGSFRNLGLIAVNGLKVRRVRAAGRTEA